MHAQFRKKRKRETNYGEEVPSGNKRRTNIFSKGKSIERFNPSFMKPNEDKPVNDLKNKLADPNYFKQEVEGLLQGFGGSYHLDFGFKDQLTFGNERKWGSILDYI